MLEKSNGTQQANATQSAQPVQNLAKGTASTTANTTNKQVILKKEEKQITSNNASANATLAKIPK